MDLNNITEKDIENWQVQEQKYNTGNTKENNVRFTFIKNHSKKRADCTFGVSIDIAKKLKFLQLGRTEIRVNDNQKHFCFTATDKKITDSGKKSYKIHYNRNKNKEICLARIVFRTDVSYSSLVDADFKTRDVNFKILGNSLVVEIAQTK